MKSALMVRELLVYHFSLNTAETPFHNCNLMQKMTHSYIQLHNYYWWIKCWRFCPIIANYQSVLLANISSYMVATLTSKGRVNSTIVGAKGFVSTFVTSSAIIS